MTSWIRVYVGCELELASGIRFQLGTADALTGLGDVARLSRNASLASTYYRQALERYARSGERRQATVALERYAGLLVRDGECESAALLFGAADAHFEITSGCLPPRPQPRHLEDVTTTRSALGTAVFARCWDTGRRWTLDDAIAWACDR